MNKKNTALSLTKQPFTGEILPAKTQTPANRYDYRIAKLAANKEMRADLIKLATNPVVEILAAYILIEMLQRATLDGKHPIIPETAGTFAEAGCLAAVGMQQLAGLAPYLAQSSEGIGGSIKSLLPLITKLPLP